MASHFEDDSRTLEARWKSDPRWEGVIRGYSAADVVRLRGSVKIAYTLAEMGAERLWQLLHQEGFVSALGALTGNQARPAGQGGSEGDLSLAAGRSPPTRTSRGRCIRTRACIP